jgi:hypothetical protein
MPDTTEHGFWKMGSDLEPADLYKVSTETSDSVEAVMCPDFTDVTFSGAWGNFGSNYEDVSYAKEGHRVWVRGTAVHATAGQTGTIFVLPVGYRPAKKRYYILPAGSGIAGVEVNHNTGVVSVGAYISGGTATGGIVLDVISFDTAP